MGNLRILDINAADSRSIKVRFSSSLSESIVASNIQVLSQNTSVPDVQVLSVQIDDDILIINTLPQTPYVRYSVVFSSTNAVRFTSLDGTQFLIEDGKSNVAVILGAENDYNTTRDQFVSYLGGSKSVYNLDRETIVRTILNELSDLVNGTIYDVRESKTANYLEIQIKDEIKTRRYGPWDRLLQEGAIDVQRVGSGPTNEVVPGSISFESFPSDPITLQQAEIDNESLVLGVGSGTYDNLVLTLTKKPVTKLLSVQIKYANGALFTYDISSYGYQINDPKYDTEFGRRYVLLETNQIKLSDDIKSLSGFVMPGGSDKIVVSYNYKSLGRVVDENTVEVVQTVSVVREPAPAISTLFSLPNAPITTSDDVIPSTGGIQFLDPYSTTPFQSTHPAFLYETPFREGGLPNSPGQFSVDYSTGRVFVYGAETNDGTGDFPPAMTYYYRKTFVPNLDYTYVPNQLDLVASPLRDLVGQTAKINYSFEQTYVPGVDYVANVHKESLNERVQNRLASMNSVYVSNSPITDVFKIFNETTGEIYSLIRFTDYCIYFNARTPPKILAVSRERASFTNILNESLVLESQTYNILGTRVLKFTLQNKFIMSGTEDVIGSSYNPSVSFSQTDVFTTELYYDAQELSESANTNRLLVGQYQINYRDGIVYVGVSAVQSLNVGTISYKNSIVSPVNTHVISVSQVYASVSATQNPSKIYNYSSFGEGEIVTQTSLLDVSDERFTDKNTENPYQFYNSTITVTDDIDTIRGIYDAYDLNNNVSPTNFAESATFNANVITLDSIGVSKYIQTIVGPGLLIVVPFISPGIVIGTVQSIIRVSDQQNLIDGYETITDTSIQLSVSSGANVGDVVNVLYTVVLNGASTPIVDYNRGDFFVDYTYLADEIIISYEYGDNIIDFRESTTLEENDTYYVTYTIGALRNSLLQNFASMVQIPELQVFDEQLDREVFRDLIQGALQTFTQGPTIPAMKQLIKQVTQIDPKIIEAQFWSLSVSNLAKISCAVLGSPYLAAGVFDQGLVVEKIGDGVTLPISNNLRLESGTLELAVIPGWDGIDNDATLTFELIKDGYALSSENIYIGASSYNPVLDKNGKFSVNKSDAQSPIGLPVLIFTQSGIFIYYDIDNKQWKVLAKDAPQINGPIYSGTITTSGDFYNSKFIPGLGELTDTLRSGSNSIDFEFMLDSSDNPPNTDGYDGYDGYIPGFSFDGIQFMSDDRHYFFDFGSNENQNRFSLYKDGKGYLVFEVWDKGGFERFKPERRSVYQVSADIQNWKSGSKHNIGISWALGSQDRRDEMHLFVDGLETPNLARYGNIPAIASTNRFRTIVPEQVAGIVTKKSIAGNDLITIQGSYTIQSNSVDFYSEGILPGDTVQIIEQGFGTYTITDVLSNTLVLSSPMPASLSDAVFSVNPVEFIVQTEIDIYTNIAVFTLSGTVETEIPGTRATIPSYSIERNALNQRILKVLGNVDVGDYILIKTFGLNHRRCRETMYLWSPSGTLKTSLPPPINLNDVCIRPIVLPLTPISLQNATVVGTDFVATLDGYDGYASNIPIITQPSSSLEGRYLEVRITGDNTNFSSPVTVTINGTSTGGPSETLLFTSATKMNTTSKWMYISSVVVTVKPIVLTEQSSAIQIKEAYSITEPAGNNLYPVIRFAYQTQAGLTLQSTDGGAIVNDPNGYFPQSMVGQLLQISSPISVSGTYKILQVIDSTTVLLDTVVGSMFSGGSYSVFNISIGRSGFQNGFFFLEKAGFSEEPYVLPQGWYEFDFATYLSVQFDNLMYQNGIIGNDITLQYPAKAVLDEFRILNTQLTDTRVGEVVGSNQQSITTGASKISPFVKNSNTLALFHFENLPPTNDSDFYMYAKKQYVQSGQSVNSLFGRCVVIKNNGLIYENNGILNTPSEGMIEFWISPIFDTYNDPNVRVYFDAAASVVEKTTSLTKGIVKLSSKTKKVLYVRLSGDTNLQGTDYFDGGSIGEDGVTLTLKQPLPSQNTVVNVAYVPSSLNGNRLTIAKDAEGFITFTVTGNNGNVYEVRQPVFWARNSWHRIRASFKFNRKDNNDQIRLFIDGEEKGSLLFGSGNILFGQGLIWGQSAIGGVGNQVFVADINFTDAIQQFSLGQDYAGNFGAQARFDNLKISNKSIDPLNVAGQPVDVYYNTNTDYIYPSIEDAFTTLIVNFDQVFSITEDFATIHDPTYGIFNFDIDIIDSFNIVTGDSRVKAILEAMIDALKPAVSTVGIKYVK